VHDPEAAYLLHGLLVAVFGALLGTAVGVFFGWAMVQALSSQGITSSRSRSSRPPIYIVLAGLIGVLAAVRPARRAARMDVLAAVPYE